MVKTKRFRPRHDPWTFTGDGRWKWRIKGEDKTMMVRKRRTYEKNNLRLEIIEVEN